MTKKSFCLTLVLVVSFIMSLPRAQETLSPRAGSLAIAGHLSRISSTLVPASGKKSGPDGIDMRLLKVRKFRRRRTTLGFSSHLQASYHQRPSLDDAGQFMPAISLLISREPDPLIHPPA